MARTLTHLQTHASFTAADWILSPEIYLRRGPHATVADRLDQILLRQAVKGVKVLKPTLLFIPSLSVASNLSRFVMYPTLSRSLSRVHGDDP